jgi:hypothetical protein
MDRAKYAESGSRVAARNAGLALLGRLRRWLAVASVALVGGFAGLAAQAKPGKSSGSPAGTSSTSNPDSRSSLRQSSDGAAVAPGISPPTQAPLPAPAAPAPPVTSGGS